MIGQNGASGAGSAGTGWVRGGLLVLVVQVHGGLEWVPGAGSTGTGWARGGVLVLVVKEQGELEGVSWSW